MTIVGACAVASQIIAATQTLTLPSGKTVTEHVSIVLPCKQRNIFYPRQAAAQQHIEALQDWAEGKAK